jgi:hypothetical protein
MRTTAFKQMQRSATVVAIASGVLLKFATIALGVTVVIAAPG